MKKQPFYKPPRFQKNPAPPQKYAFHTPYVTFQTEDDFDRWVRTVIEVYESGDGYFKKALQVNAARQQTEDEFCIALNQSFGFGRDRLNRLIAARKEIHQELIETAQEDIDANIQKNTPREQIPYFWKKIETAMAQAFGKDGFEPWEKRYEWTVTEAKKRMEDTEK